jgi:hypothetical protein
MTVQILTPVMGTVNQGGRFKIHGYLLRVNENIKQTDPMIIHISEP